MFFLHIKSLPNLLFGVLCLPGDQSHPFAQPRINPLALCICWAGLLGRAVFPPWNEGPNFGSYNLNPKRVFLLHRRLFFMWWFKGFSILGFVIFKTQLLGSTCSITSEIIKDCAWVRPEVLHISFKYIITSRTQWYVHSYATRKA